MTPVTAFLVSPEEFEVIIKRRLQPIIEQLNMLQDLPDRKYAYTPKQVAELIGYKTDTVLIFIREGRKDRRGRMNRLPAIQITERSYRVLPEQLQAWLRCF